MNKSPLALIMILLMVFSVAGIGIAHTTNEQTPDTTLAQPTDALSAPVPVVDVPEEPEPTNLADTNPTTDIPPTDLRSTQTDSGRNKGPVITRNKAARNEIRERKESFTYTGAITLTNLQGTTTLIYENGELVGEITEQEELIEEPIEEPGTTFITECQDITESGHYTLANSIRSEGTCIDLKVDNVYLTCDGHTIYYAAADAGHGIFSHENKEVTIHDCRINQASDEFKSSHAIRIENAAKQFVLKSKVETLAPQSAGVHLKNVIKSELTGNTITTQNEEANGVTFQNSIANMMESNNIETKAAYAHGLAFTRSNENTILSNEVITKGKFSDTLFLRDAKKNEFNNNNIVAEGGGASAVILERLSESNLFKNNHIKGAVEGDAFKFNFDLPATAVAELLNTIIVDNQINNIGKRDINVISGVGNLHLTLVDQPITEYDLSDDGITLEVKETNTGEVTFMPHVTGEGDQFSQDVKIDTNYVQIAEEKAGLNTPIEIKLENIPSFTTPTVFRNGEVCSDCVVHGNIETDATFSAPGSGIYTIGEAQQELIPIVEEELIEEPTSGGGGCVASWSCEAWSACSPEGVQTRTCTPTTPEEWHCYIDESTKPAETQSCTFVEQTEVQPDTLPVEQVAQQGALARITGAVTGLSNPTKIAGAFLFILIIIGLYAAVAAIRAR